MAREERLERPWVLVLVWPWSQHSGWISHAGVTWHSSSAADGLPPSSVPPHHCRVRSPQLLAKLRNSEGGRSGSESAGGRQVPCQCAAQGVSRPTTCKSRISEEEIQPGQPQIPHLCLRALAPVGVPGWLQGLSFTYPCSLLLGNLFLKLVLHVSRAWPAKFLAGQLQHSIASLC